MQYPQGLKPKDGCNWWIELGEGLEEQGFKRLESDWGLYYRPAGKGRGFAMLLAYVDDIVAAAETRQEVVDILAGMTKRWKMTLWPVYPHLSAGVCRYPYWTLRAEKTSINPARLQPVHGDRWQLAVVSSQPRRIRC